MNQQSQMLDYVILEKEKFIINGKNKIQNIMNKNTAQCWTSQFPCSSLQIKLKLKTPTYVTSLQTRVTDAPAVDVTFKNQQQKVLLVKKLLFSGSKTSLKNIQANQKIAYVDIVLSTNSSKDQAVLGLVYFLLKGVKTQPPPSKNINNLSKNDQFQNYGQPNKTAKTVAPSNPYSKLANNLKKKQGDYFSNRIKQKQTKQKQKYQEEDTQLQKALMESQKQFRKKAYKLKREQENDFLQKMESQSGCTEPLGEEYQLLKFKDVKMNLLNVNHRWIQAQRKAEQDFKIKQQHRLSNFLQVRFFTNLNFCILNAKKSNGKLEAMIQQLGGKIIKQPKEYCYVISESKQSEKVKKAIKIKGVKAINQNFVLDSKKCNAIMEVKDYLLKV